MRLKRAYTYSQPREALWDGHRADRDRTTERIEVGLRVHDALTATPRCTYTEGDRRCVKTTNIEHRHLLALMRTLDDVLGLTEESTCTTS